MKTLLTVEDLSLIVQTLEAKINHDEIMIKNFYSTYTRKEKSTVIERQKVLIKELKEIVKKLNVCIDSLNTM